MNLDMIHSPSSQSWVVVCLRFSPPSHSPAIRFQHSNIHFSFKVRNQAARCAANINVETTSYLTIANHHLSLLSSIATIYWTTLPKCKTISRCTFSSGRKMLTVVMAWKLHDSWKWEKACQILSYYQKESKCPQCIDEKEKNNVFLALLMSFSTAFSVSIGLWIKVWLRTNAQEMLEPSELVVVVLVVLLEQ